MRSHSGNVDLHDSTYAVSKVMSAFNPFLPNRLSKPVREWARRHVSNVVSKNLLDPGFPSEIYDTAMEIDETCSDSMVGIMHNNIRETSSNEPSSELAWGGVVRPWRCAVPLLPRNEDLQEVYLRTPEVRHLESFESSCEAVLTTVARNSTCHVSSEFYNWMGGCACLRNTDKDIWHGKRRIDFVRSLTVNRPSIHL